MLPFNFSRIIKNRITSLKHDVKLEIELTFAEDDIERNKELLQLCTKTPKGILLVYNEEVKAFMKFKKFKNEFIEFLKEKHPEKLI